MGWEHPPETVWKAQELYCCDRLSFDRVAELTGVSATTLKAWADKYGWREKREEIAQAESDIRVNTVMGRKKVLERLVVAQNGMEASQLSFAVSALETLAMKQQEAIRAGKIMEQAAAQPAEIRTTADIPAALEEAVRLKLGMLLADPGQVDFKAIKDIKQAMDYLAQLRPKDEAESTQGRGLTLESANAIRKQILGIK
jgi:hypothetical protein